VRKRIAPGTRRAAALNAGACASHRRTDSRTLRCAAWWAGYRFLCWLACFLPLFLRAWHHTSAQRRLPGNASICAHRTGRCLPEFCWHRSANAISTELFCRFLRVACSAILRLCNYCAQQNRLLAARAARESACSRNGGGGGMEHQHRQDEGREEDDLSCASTTRRRTPARSAGAACAAKEGRIKAQTGRRSRRRAACPLRIWNCDAEGEDARTHAHPERPRIVSGTGALRLSAIASTASAWLSTGRA